MLFSKKIPLAVKAVTPTIGRWTHRFHRRDATGSALATFLIAQGAQQGLQAECYPWCFALPGEALGLSQTLTGAVAMQSETVLYASLSDVALQECLQEPHSLAFWLARALVAQPRMVGRTSGRVCRHVARHYRACAGLKQSPPLLAWLRDCCEEDYSATESGGVQFMPWAGWPACINKGGYLWLWKQNQHGRIVASHRVPLSVTRGAHVPVKGIFQ
ncbi:hypothetical protein [Siccibacter colletis]|uniref:Uncharacterized protein n=1 Tax=Siccibacter colletis TaxID=1505757 RepID=A0ABY6JBU9_9ENTR|nr:hypothetical protein [Siccibacter colletis]UYU31320.1 hypothetical protein KFZ77_15970 [Siccibacter colletis]